MICHFYHIDGYVLCNICSRCCWFNCWWFVTYSIDGYVLCDTCSRCYWVNFWWFAYVWCWRLAFMYFVDLLFVLLCCWWLVYMYIFTRLCLSSAPYDVTESDPPARAQGTTYWGLVLTKLSLPPISVADPKEMITPMLRKALTKQGYKLIGSHSGVKLCRWTKAMLRGRGGCYKVWEILLNMGNITFYLNMEDIIFYLKWEL